MDRYELGSPKCMYLFKRYFIIDQQKSGILCNSECLSNPLPFYANQITNPFLNSRISANHDKG